VSGAGQPRARDKVLVAVVECFDGRPLAEISLLEIQQRADVSSSTLHYVFPTKEALVRAAHEHFLGEQLAVLTAELWATSYDHLPLDEVLVDLITRYVEFFTTTAPRMVTFRDAERTYPDLTSARETVDGRVIASVIDYLRGRGAVADDEAAARCQFAMRSVTATVQRFFGPPLPFAEVMGVPTEWVAEQLASLMTPYLLGPLPH